MWLGIQMGKQSIRSGATRIVGSGTSMMALKEKWLPEAKGFMPQLIPDISIDENTRVAGLMILGLRAWNWEFIV